MNELSAERRDLYLATDDTHDRHPCRPAGLEPTIPAGEWPQNEALDRAASGTGIETVPLGTVRPSFPTLQRRLFMYLINKYISLSDICLTVHR